MLCTALVHWVLAAVLFGRHEAINLPSLGGSNQPGLDVVGNALNIVQDLTKVVTGVVQGAVDLAGNLLPEIVEFSSFATRFGKNYSSKSEEIFRKGIYDTNIEAIKDHNDQQSQGEVDFRLGINKYTDLTPEELSKMNGYRKSQDDSSQKRTPSKSLIGGLGDQLGGLLDLSGKRRKRQTQLPLEVDWTKKGFVAEVKDQGECGSCYAFAAITALEAQFFNRTGRMEPLSVQNIIDCSNDYGNAGCSGGNPSIVYEYVRDYGIENSEEYPYKTSEDKCKFSGKKSIAQVKDFVNLPEGSEEALMEAVATIGPIAVAIDASSVKFQFYRSGIFSDLECTTSINHAIVVVGYGTIDGQDYWLILNSWSKAWGIGGFALIARNKGNMCGIATDASYPIL